MRPRGYKGAIEELRKSDPDCELTIYALRLLVKQNRVPVILVGRRHLLDVDSLIDYLKNPDLRENEICRETKIRRISN